METVLAFVKPVDEEDAAELKAALAVMDKYNEENNPQEQAEKGCMTFQLFKMIDPDTKVVVPDQYVIHGCFVTPDKANRIAAILREK